MVIVRGFILMAAVGTMAGSRAGAADAVLPGTVVLTFQGDPVVEMVAGIDRFLSRELEAALASRPGEQRTSPSTADLRRIIGAVDGLCDRPSMNLVATTTRPAQIASGPGYTVQAVRWPVFEGVDGEGLLLEPQDEPVACVIALPDADHTPEMLVGLERGIEPAGQFARRLAENGCRVLVPVLIDRSDTFSGNAAVSMTNQPHREFIYRMAYQVGRHIIGYEVQKVIAGIDWFMADAARRGARLPRIGVIGHGEGGLIALHAAAIDPRIESVVVSGYFHPPDQIDQEPIYRNVWRLLPDFRNAGLASMIVPRTVIVEACRGPQVEGPPPEREGRAGAAPGRLTTPPLDAVRAEFELARRWCAGKDPGEHLRLVVSGGGVGPPGCQETLSAFIASLGGSDLLVPPGTGPFLASELEDTQTRLKRQVEQLVAFTQHLAKQSAFRRDAFWSQADTSSVPKWQETTQRYRDYLWDEIIGRFEPATLPANPRTRKVFDQPRWTGYEVMLDVWPDVFAWGVLLVPRDISPGERRPVIVCQHGLEGRTDKVVDPAVESLYQSFGAQLADRGFVVFAPQNPYVGGNTFRQLQRKANPIGRSLFSIIVRQHERILEWLGGLPFVDAERIGIYGISYGGKTVMRVAPLIEGYAVAVCSADFNEYTLKMTTLDYRTSFMYVEEYEMFDFDMANRFNYGDLAGLIAPRPFMVERGHGDPVARDEWVAWEYARVRRLYDHLRIGERTTIEFFEGGHEIHAVGSFEFLERWLRPAPR